MRFKVGNLKGFLIGIAFIVILMASALGGALADRIFVIKPLDFLAQRSEPGTRLGGIEQRVFKEESVVVDVAEKLSPSVVTVSVETPRRRVLEYNPFGGGFSSRFEGGTPQDIGSGFIVDAGGLIVTNKHVVSDTSSKYKVVTQDDREFEVVEIHLDPANDLA